MGVMEAQAALEQQLRARLPEGWELASVKTADGRSIWALKTDKTVRTFRSLGGVQSAIEQHHDKAAANEFFGEVG